MFHFCETRSFLILFCITTRIHRVAVFIRLGDFALYAAGNADGDDIRGNGFRHDTPRADNGIVPDGHTCKHSRTCTNPNIIADGNRFCDFQARFALFGVGRMLGGRKTAIRSDKNVVAEGDLCAVLNHQIVVRIKPIAYRDVVAVIAPKRRCNYWDAID